MTEDQKEKGPQLPSDKIHALWTKSEIICETQQQKYFFYTSFWAQLALGITKS